MASVHERPPAAGWGTAPKMIAHSTGSRQRARPARCIAQLLRVEGRAADSSEKQRGATGRPGTPRRDFGGAEGARTPDPKTASLVLSQLSYSPTATPRLPSGGEVVKRGRHLPRAIGGGRRATQALAAFLAALNAAS